MYICLRGWLLAIWLCHTVHGFHGPIARRDWLGQLVLVGVPVASSAAEPDEAEAARIARKLELQKKSMAGGAAPPAESAYRRDGQLPDDALNVRSDFNPEAGQNLRSRTLSQSYDLEKRREKEYKRTRDDLCEVLGRGC